MGGPSGSVQGPPRPRLQFCGGRSMSAAVGCVGSTVNNRWLQVTSSLSALASADSWRCGVPADACWPKFGGAMLGCRCCHFCCQPIGLTVILLPGQLAPGVVFRLDRVEVTYGVAVVLPLLVEDHVQAGEGGLRVFGIVRVHAGCSQLP